MGMAAYVPWPCSLFFWPCSGESGTDELWQVCANDAAATAERLAIYVDGGFACVSW